MKERWNVRQIAAVLAVGAVFMLVSLIADTYRTALAAVVGVGGPAGIAAYVALTMCFEIFLLPLDLALLVPLGTALYGPTTTALMSITGWTVGASVSFILARRYGIRFVTTIVGAKRVEQIRRRVPRSNLFWSVVLLRMLVPVGLLSYTLGLFAPIAWWKYVVATALGVAPLGFYFAFTGALPFVYQFLALAAALWFVIIVLSRYQFEHHERRDGPVV